MCDCVHRLPPHPTSRPHTQARFVYTFRPHGTAPLRSRSRPQPPRMPMPNVTHANVESLSLAATDCPLTALRTSDEPTPGCNLVRLRPPQITISSDCDLAASDCDFPRAPLVTPDTTVGSPDRWPMAEITAEITAEIRSSASLGASPQWPSAPQRPARGVSSCQSWTSSQRSRRPGC